MAMNSNAPSQGAILPMEYVATDKRGSTNGYLTATNTHTPLAEVATENQDTPQSMPPFLSISVIKGKDIAFHNHVSQANKCCSIQ